MANRPYALIDSMTPTTIDITLEGPRAARSIFDDYRAACKGCRAVKVGGGLWVNKIAASKALPVIEAMREVEGLDVRLTDKALAALESASPEAEAEAAKPVAYMVLAGDKVEIRLGGGYAGREIFDAYRAACKGCKAAKKGGEWVNTIPMVDVEPVLDAMRSIDGLAVDVDAEIITTLKGRAEDVLGRLEAARERLAETDAELAKRGMALYPYQHHGVEWLSAQDAAILGDDMGLGKTVQALLAAPEGAPILVISPAVAKGVWVREAGKWRPDLKPVFLKGRTSFRWPEPGEMIVTNYDILPKEGTAGPAPEGVIIIADEAHKIKNPKAQMTKKFRSLANAARMEGGKVWLLTATPLLGKPPELWALLETIDRIPFRNKREFSEMMGGELDYIPRVGNVWAWRGTPDPEVAERLQPLMLRRMKREVLTDLPSKRYQDIQVPASALKAATRKQLDEICKKWDKVTGDPDRLPPFEMLSEALAILANAKIPTMLELVEEYEEAGEPLVVMSAHRAPIDLFLDREGWGVITGDGAYINGKRVPERSVVQDAFQAGELKGVAATIQAGGVAITLTHASNAIFVDLDWTPALNAQAEDRIYRIGQTRGVLITRLVADHAIDQRLAVLLASKQDLIDASVDAARRQGDESAVSADEAKAHRLDALADELSRETEALIEDLSEVIETQEEYRAKVRKLSADIRQDVERQMEEDWQRQIRERAERRGVEILVAEEDEEDIEAIEERRAPATNVEEWAAEGLVLLHAWNRDMAQQKNDVGFNKADTLIGAQLAMRVSGGLSATEWALAVAMLAKYWRQIGPMPEVVRDLRKKQLGLFDN